MGMTSPMPWRIHFISGLPRSGSTLLSALLRQNPRFRAGIVSPLGPLFLATLNAMGATEETSLYVSQEQRVRVLRGLFTSYYGAHPADTVIFDSSRLWAARLPALLRLFPEARMICCVRDVGWVMDSLERLTRQHPFLNSRLFDSDIERNTVYSRVETLAQRNRLVGFAWCAVKEAFYGEEADRMLLVDYDLLVARPVEAIALIYQFLGESPFSHDFTSVSHDEPEFDARLGLPGMHWVQGPVAPRPRPSLLPPDLFAQYSDMSFWRVGPPGRAAVIAPKPTAVAPPDQSVAAGP
ncbi:sulfotransferase family protein [Pararhodospirillum photometricum]|nr:sulfotransferase [Pararhodospirillum photometricum]